MTDGEVSVYRCANKNAVNGTESMAITSGEIQDALETKYALPEWAYFPEVSSGTGAYHSRTADGIAISLWPSRGYETLGFEIKVSRSDFLREIKNPEKAEELFKYCDKWWLVTPKDLVKVEEVPKTWGLMVIQGDKLLVVKPAPQLEDVKPWGRPFVASLMRDIRQLYVSKKSIQKQLDAASRDGEARGKSDYQRKLGDYEKLLQRVKEFECASGVCISNPWSQHGEAKIGAAVNIVLNHGVKEQAKKIEWLRNHLRLILENIEKAVSELQSEQASKNNEQTELQARSCPN